MITIRGEGWTIKRSAITHRTLNKIMDQINDPEISVYYAVIDEESKADNIIITVHKRQKGENNAQ